MNPVAAIAGLLTLIAFSVHAIVGGREFRHLRPDSRPMAGAEKAREVWLQSLSGWHWVSVDLLLAAVALLTVGVSDAIADEDTVLLVISGYFLLCAVSWLGTVLLAGRGVERGYLKLAQWLFCLVIAGLAFFAR